MSIYETGEARVPRPTGTTMLSLEYQKTNAEDIRVRLIKTIVSQYINSGFRLNGVPIPIPRLSQILKVKQEEIMHHVNTHQTALSSIFSTDKLKNTVDNLTALSFEWALKDRGLAERQTELLMRSQGDSYKAFISSEVTRSIKLLSETNSNLMNHFKTFLANQQAIDLIQILKSGELDKEKPLTTDVAIQLIQKNLPKHDPTKSIENLADKHNIKALEESYLNHIPPASAIQQNQIQIDDLIIEEDSDINLSSQKTKRKRKINSTLKNTNNNTTKHTPIFNPNVTPIIDNDTHIQPNNEDNTFQDNETDLHSDENEVPNHTGAALGLGFQDRSLRASQPESYPPKPSSQNALKRVPKKVIRRNSHFDRRATDEGLLDT